MTVTSTIGTTLTTAPKSTIVSGDATGLYLELLKRVLMGTVGGNEEIERVRPKRLVKRALSSLLEHFGFALARVRRFDAVARIEGRDWPAAALTMVGRARLDNIEACVRAVIADGVQGDFIETGVWRGGASIFMRATADVLGGDDRHIWLADSFRGLPPPDGRFPQDRDSLLHLAPELAVTVAEVQANIAAFGFLDERVHFIEGFFADTLPNAPIQRLSIMRLDGDMYSSTWDALTNLYPKLSPGGFVIVDDYNALESCRMAVTDFRHAQGIEDDLKLIDWSGAYWRKSS